MKHYESGRLYPYREAKRGFHNNEALQMAYESWAHGIPGRREEQWDVYCDIRDGFAIGTNKSIREKFHSSKMEFSEARYIAALK